MLLNKLYKIFIKLYILFYMLKITYKQKIFGFDHVVNILRHAEKFEIMPIMKRFGAIVGLNCDIEPGIVLHRARENFANLIIENNCYIGENAFFDIGTTITIKARTTISARVTILTHIDIGHCRISDKRYKQCLKPVEIGPDTYIGANVTILSGVSIGTGSIIGAGALLNKDVPPNVVVGGVPARIIKKIN